LGKNHLKRKPAPNFWPIHRKEMPFTFRPKPGPHPIKNCLPLALITREILGFARTGREAKMIISQGKVKIDGRVQREEKFPVGLMDVVSITDLNKDYRILPSKNGLLLHSIGKEEASYKLCKVKNKKTVKKGHMQINLHDGRNVAIKFMDSQEKERDVYNTYDTLRINIPNQEVIEHLKLIEGAPVIITGGKNAGMSGKIVSIEEMEGRERRKALVTMESSDGKHIRTILDFIFIVGDTQPCISLPEVS
jgi:small subunit ribosomal protein S4e